MLTSKLNSQSFLSGKKKVKIFNTMLWSDFQFPHSSLTPTELKCHVSLFSLYTRGFSWLYPSHPCIPFSILCSETHLRTIPCSLWELSLDGWVTYLLWWCCHTAYKPHIISCNCKFLFAGSPISLNLFFLSNLSIHILFHQHITTSISVDTYKILKCMFPPHKMTKSTA